MTTNRLQLRPQRRLMSTRPAPWLPPVTAPASLTSGRFFLPSQKHLEINPLMDYLNLYLHQTPNLPPGQLVNVSQCQGSMTTPKIGQWPQACKWSIVITSRMAKHDSCVQLWVRLLCWSFLTVFRKHVRCIFLSFLTENHLELRLGK